MRGSVKFINLVLEGADAARCVEWPGKKTGAGYAQYRGAYVHRMVCERVHGPPPTPKHHAAHSCDNPPCINPHHLSWKTAKGNASDRVERGRQVRGSRQGSAKLKEIDIPDIRKRLERGESLRAVGRAYGVSHEAIRRIESGVTWAHIESA